LANKGNDISSGSIFKSPLYRRFLAPIILTMLGFAVAVYFLAVPYIKELVYSLEEKSVNTNLTNIHKLIEANSLAIDAYKKSVTAAHERQIKNITLFMETYLKNKYNQVQNGLISMDEAQWTALEELRAFRYGNNDYVWVADYNGYYLSHPDPKMNMEDFSEVRDVFGNYVLTPLIQQALAEGEGYHSFWWQRLEDDLPAEKLTYAKLFHQWEWVIGTGVYLDDLESEILLRKEKMIEELRQILKPITIGKSGYMYIFDSWQNIIIHPDASLENNDMSTWENPVTGNKLADDLIAVSHSLDSKVAYKWNRPDDKENYIYDKIDWVTHVEAFDWYVVASVYTEELEESSIHLRNRILFLAGGVVLVSIIIVSLLMSRLINPIRRLSGTAGRVKSGDLTAQSDVQGNDEIGFLAKAFNAMVAQLREIIQELDQKVLERTKDLDQANKDLTATVGMLEMHNSEVTQLNLMAEKLQGCHSLQEIFEVIVEALSALFDGSSGIFYVNEGDEDKEVLVPVVNWGEHPNPKEEYNHSDCRSLEVGRVALTVRPGDDPVCNHIKAESPYVSLCLPLLGQYEVLAMINIQFSDIQGDLSSFDNEQKIHNWHQLAISVTDHLAMAMANMKLRERLQTLSVRDGLTGLFNRRYMEETLAREFSHAERNGQPIGVIILDVDFFKKFNDTYGHEAGDIVLIELSNTLTKSVRKGDVVCRYGGEEFVVILPGPPSERSIERAETIRSNVENGLRIQYHEHEFQVTISLGAAVFPVHGSTPEEVLKAADNALYRAKEQGRNRAVSA